MTREEFLSYRSSTNYPVSIFKEYYELHSEIPFVEETFNLYIMHCGGGRYAQSLLQNIIIPYYNIEFSIIDVLDKESKLIYSY